MTSTPGMDRIQQLFLDELRAACTERLAEGADPAALTADLAQRIRNLQEDIPMHRDPAYREESRFEYHPRVTWFGRGGMVAYVDYVNPFASYFVGDDGHGKFQVVPPEGVSDIRGDFATFDDAVDYALTQVPDPNQNGR